MSPAAALLLLQSALAPAGSVELPIPGAVAEVTPARIPAGRVLESVQVVIDTGDEPLETFSTLCLGISPKDTQDLDRYDFTVTTSPEGLGLQASARRTTDFLRVVEMRLINTVPPHARITVALTRKAPGNSRPTGFIATREFFWVWHVPPVRSRGRVLGAIRQIPVRGGVRPPGPAHRLSATLDSSVPAGGEVALRVAVLDAAGNPAEFAGGAEVTWSDGRADRFEAGALASGRAVLRRPAAAAGVLRAELRAAGLQPSASNPCWVHPPGELDGRRILYGDEQVHTRRSDGSLGLLEVLGRARQWGCSDWIAVTDHDRGDLSSMDRDRGFWERGYAAMKAFSTPEFAVVPALEWTQRLNKARPEAGHRCVLAADAAALLPLPDSDNLATRRLPGLLETLDARGIPSVAIPHHLRHYSWWDAQGLSAADRDRAAPVSEVFARTHGDYESEESGWRDHPTIGWGNEPRPGLSWRAGLEQGARTGAVGGSDNHMGWGGFWRRPLAYRLTAEELAAAWYRKPLAADRIRYGTFTAVAAERNEPASIVAALQARRCWASTGPRFVIAFTAAGRELGEEAEWAAERPVPLEARVLAEAPLVAVEFFRVTPGRTELVHREDLAGAGVLDWKGAFTDTGAPTGAAWRAYYLRVRQAGLTGPGYTGPEERAITSPVWLDAGGPGR